MATIELTPANFRSTIGGNAMVVVDCWAPWCAPCRGFAPTFEAASQRHGDVVFAKVNTQEQEEMASAFNIRSIPTLMVFRDQIMLFSEAGSLPAPALDQLISQVRALDMDDIRRQIAAESASQEGQG